MTEPEHEKTEGYYEAGENYQEGILDTGYIAARFLRLSLCGLCGIRLLSFHNFELLKFLSFFGLFDY